MTKLLIKLTIKLLNYLSNNIKIDFNKNEVNDIVEIAKLLEEKIEK